MFYRQLESILQDGPRMRIAVAGAEGDALFASLRRTEKLGISQGICIGQSADGAEILQRSGIQHFDVKMALDAKDAAEQAVREVRDGRADFLMKGSISTAAILKAVLNEKSMLLEGARLAHFALLESPEGRVLGVTDAGVHIRPNLDQKRQILESAVHAFHGLGVDEPKVAVLAAIEKENSHIPESMDAGVLSRLQDSGVINACIVDGPIALDLAVSPMACRNKHYGGKIQGDADILLVHDVSAGNILVKSLVYLGGWKFGGVVVGARCPIILSSRGDSPEEKYHSILLATALLQKSVMGAEFFRPRL